MPYWPSRAGPDLAAGPAHDGAEHDRQAGAAAGGAPVGAARPGGIRDLALGTEQDLPASCHEPRPRRGTLGRIRLALATLNTGHTRKRSPRAPPEAGETPHAEPQKIRP